MEMLELIKEYIRPELMILIPVLYLLGVAGKKNKYFKDKNFVPGRKVMTCCADDTQFIGYISFYNNIAALENREWIWVTATIKYEFQMAYKKKGPVLYVESVEKTGAPKEEMVFF